jgi:hypothetical protein
VRGNALRSLVPALVVLALVGVVAIAATGSTPSGTDDSRPPAEALLDALFSLWLVLLVPAAAILVYGLMQRKEIAREMATKRYHRSGLLGFMVFVFIVMGIVYWRMRNYGGIQFSDDTIQDVVVGGENAPEPTPDGSGTTYEPEFAWVPVLVVLALVAIGVAATFLAMRRRKRALTEDEIVARALADALDESLDDLRAEADPRRAVIAAYARLERVLGGHGAPKRAAETPEEYLTRILPALEVDRRSIRRLTDLFTQAKFSHHEVDAGMKEEAIAALSTVRDELRAARARRDEERAAAMSAPVEGRA